MGKCPRQIKREKEAKRRGNVNERENVRDTVKAIVSEAKRNRAHGNSSGGGHIPSAKHVGGAVERTAFSVDGTRAPHMGRAYEGIERYDEPGPGANRPLERYRAPSLKTRIEPARPAVEPDYGRRGKGAPAVKARVDRVDEAIARKNAYARRGDYSGEGPALLPLPPIEVIKPYPRPEKVAVTYIIQGGSIVELDDYRVEPRVFRVDPLKGRRYTRVRLGAAGHMGPVTSVTRVLPPARRVTYHPGYDTSAWTRVRAPEELVYRALVML